MNDNLFLDNKPILKLDEEKDLFGNLEKANFLKTFLEENIEYIRKNNMIVLYGNWGSGKTTIFYAIKERINTDFYFPIIFNAWRCEKDGNLAYSLYEFLLDKLEIGGDKLKKAREIGKAVLKGVLKSVNLIEKIIEVYEENLDKKEEISSYKKISDFEEMFNKIIKEFHSKTNRYLLIFIDELDRCEPLAILNLLSSIKILLTLGRESTLEQDKSKIMFLCGVDRNAVTKAVDIQFKDKIKAEEYLEKIFDISFNMPVRYETKIIIEKYFGKHSDAIAKFINYINFYNPRHLKKIINKYLILSQIKRNKDSKYSEFIPNIITSEKGYLFDTIMVLYFIILYEFYNDKFYEIKNYDEKISNYIDYLVGDRQNQKAIENIKNQINECFKIKNKKDFLLLKNISNSELMNRKGDENPKRLFQFINFFTPKIYDTFTMDLSDISYYDQFEYEGNEILIDFCKYLFEHIGELAMEPEERKEMGDYNLNKLFEMAEILL
jgi:hypothetical protein